MLTKKSGEFEVRCDVCGRIETIPAHNHVNAWEVIKRRAWAVRRNASPIIHVCPECPVEVSHARAN